MQRHRHTHRSWPSRRQRGGSRPAFICMPMPAGDFALLRPAITLATLIKPAQQLTVLLSHVVQPLKAGTRGTVQPSRDATAPAVRQQQPPARPGPLCLLSPGIAQQGGAADQARVIGAAHHQGEPRITISAPECARPPVPRQASLAASCCSAAAVPRCGHASDQCCRAPAPLGGVPQRTAASPPSSTAPFRQRRCQGPVAHGTCSQLRACQEQRWRGRCCSCLFRRRGSRRANTAPRSASGSDVGAAGAAAGA